GLQFVIPKGGYRLSVRTDSPSASPDSGPDASPAEGRRSRSAGYWLLASVLVLSVLANGWLWYRGSPHTASSASIPDPVRARVRASPIWADLVASRRPLTLVLGDLFMFTQIDART